MQTIKLKRGLEANIPTLQHGELGYTIDSDKLFIGNGLGNTLLATQELFSGFTTTLHYHDSDRNRSNHTGTQLSSTISDFNTAVNGIISSASIDADSLGGISPGNYARLDIANNFNGNAIFSLGSEIIIKDGTLTDRSLVRIDGGITAAFGNINLPVNIKSNGTFTHNGNTILDITHRGVANGVASLDGSGLIPTSQLPSYVDDVIEVATLPGTGETGKIYVVTTDNSIWRWTGTQFIEISSGVGTADEALRLATPRTIQLSGDATGFTLFDGSENVIITTTVVNSDKWDGYQFSDYLDQAVKTTSDVTFNKLILKTNLQDSETDIQLGGNANIATTSSLYFFCDSDNNATGLGFHFRTNAAFGEGDKLFTIADDGSIKAFLGPINIGDSAYTTGDTLLNFYDFTSGVYRTIRWDDSQGDWRVEDNTGVNRTLWHAGNDGNFAKLNINNTFTGANPELRLKSTSLTGISRVGIYSQQAGDTYAMLEMHYDDNSNFASLKFNANGLRFIENNNGVESIYVEIGAAGHLFANEQLYIGQNTTGDSTANFYDLNSATWRSVKWSNVNNDWYVEDNNGTDRLLYHTGNLIISNYSPIASPNFTDQVDITGAGSQLRLFESDAADPNDFVLLERNSENFNIYHWDNSASSWQQGLKIRPNGTVDFFGAVTINPTSVAGKQAGLVLKDSGGGAGEGLYIQFGNNNTLDLVRIGIHSTSEIVSGDSANIAFSVKNGTDVNPVEKMTLDRNGNLSIHYGELNIGSDGIGSTKINFYDDNSNTWRTFQWSDSGNGWYGEDNAGTNRQFWDEGNFDPNTKLDATAKAADTTLFDGYTKEQLHYRHSGRDFPNGTLIQTDIDYSQSTGDAWVIEIKGNGYGWYPIWLMYQGYIYNNTMINHKGYNWGSIVDGMSFFNYNGNLCFWFPYQTYWQGFNVYCYSASSGTAVRYNRVTNITNEAKPAGITKELSCSFLKGWNENNDGPDSGLNADLLDNYHASTTADGNTIVLRDGNGDIFARYFSGNFIYLSHGIASRTNDTIFYSGYDNYIRKNDAAGMRASLGVVASSEKGAANGVASLDATGLVPTSQLPSYVDDVIEVSSLPGTGETGKIYVNTTDGSIWRWTGSAFIEINTSVASADSALKLATARTISLTGDVTGSTSFDGSANVSITATVADDSHNHTIANVDNLQTTIDKILTVDDSFVVQDTRSVNVPTDFGEKGIAFHFKSNGIDALTDGGSFHGVIAFQPWDDSSGGSTYNLGFTPNSNLWIRSATIGGTWGTWYKFYHQGNLNTSDFVKGNGVDNGTITIKCNDADFIVQDSTDTTTNYIWRDHSGGVLYLGSPTAILSLRSDLHLNSNIINGVYGINITGNGEYPVNISGTNNGKIVLQGSDQPYIRFREGAIDKAYIQWANSGYLQIVNQEDSSRLRIKDVIDFTQDGVTYYNILHTGYGTIPNSTSGNAATATNAAALGGKTAAVNATGDTLVLRDAEGDLNARYTQCSHVSLSHNFTSRTTDTTFFSTTDNYVRKNDAVGMRTSLGVLSSSEIAAAYLGISANALSASKLATARTITLSGDVDGSTTFDGSGNVTITTSILGDYLQSQGLSASWGVTSGANTGAFNAIMGASTSATWLVSGTSGGVFRGGIQLLDSGGTMRLYTNSNYISITGSTITASLTGNADTATALATARTINGTSFNGSANITTAKWGTSRTLSLTGDVTGSMSVDGSGNASMTTTVQDDSHNHVISNIDGLQAALDAGSGSVNKIATYYYEGVAQDEDLIIDGVYFKDNVVIQDVSMFARVAPTGADFTIKITLDGSEQTGTATLTSGNKYQTTTLNQACTTAQRFGLKIKSIGSTEPGQGITITVNYYES